MHTADLRQVLVKDRFFLQQHRSRHQEKNALWQKSYQTSHHHYLQRLKHKPCTHYAQRLPVLDKAEEIKTAITQYQVVIICGETGSGKTTQIPKFCLDVGLGISGMIGHTQPRRIAARSVAIRVADELNCVLGKQVGYKVRFNDVTSRNTYIKVMTDGILLSEIRSDRYLLAYDTVIIDEAHERSLNIDFLLGYLKKILSKRNDLKLIITSATIDVERFSQHFYQAPVIEVSGKIYPVEIRYRPFNVQDENEANLSLPEAISQAIQELWQVQKEDVLVFLPGEREIKEAQDTLNQNEFFSHSEIISLFSRLSVKGQQQIFRRSTHQSRIILSTNIAETSLTVPGIKYVIDSGLAKVRRYATRAKMEQLRIEKISQAAAKQRAGRCGRISAGVCVRLYSKEDFEQRSAFTDPEIIRSNLARVILLLSYLRFGDIERFPFMDMPDARLIRNGKQILYELGALDEQRQITELGKQMAQLPLDPQLARILLAAKAHHCVYELLIIISVLSIQDPKESPLDQREAAQQAHSIFYDPRSDFLSDLKLWHFFTDKIHNCSNRQIYAFCRQYFLSYLRMREWRDIFFELKGLVDQMGWHIARGHDNSLPEKESYRYESIHRALLSGLGMQVGKKDLKEKYYTGVHSGYIYIFPTSVLFKKSPAWIMAEELVQTSKLYARKVAMIEPEWIEKELPHLVKSHYFNPRWSNQKGEVVVSERVALYSLTLVPERTTMFAYIDPIVSREIFIKEGLIAGELNLDAKFYLNNRDIINQVKELEQAQRQDFAWQEALFHFYDERLAQEIVGIISLKQWLTESPTDRNDLLSVKLNDLIHTPQRLQVEAQFPKTFSLAGILLTLSYRFEPYHPKDGVTLHVPLELLNKINSLTLEWLVPGLIREKLYCLIKALPKKIRKICVPVPQFVTRFLESQPSKNQSIYSQLSFAIAKEAGDISLQEEIDVPSWRRTEIPTHLVMNIQVIDQHGHELAMGRDLLMLRKKLSEEAKNAFQRLGYEELGIEKTEITYWNIGTIPHSVNFYNKDRLLMAYPALCHVGKDRISLCMFDTESAAQEAHRQGLIALMQLQLKTQIKDLQKFQWLDFVTIILSFNNIYSNEQLKKDILAAVSAAVFLNKDTPLVYDEHNFQRQIDVARKRLPLVKSELAKYLLEVAYHYRQLESQLSSHALKDSVNQQLSTLIYRGFVKDIPWALWPRLPIYLKAIGLRLQKYAHRRKHDEQNQLEINRLEQVWHQAQQIVQPEEQKWQEALQKFRWKLQELRISLFAQELKTLYPVSVTRLQKEWQLLLKYFNK